MVQLEQFFYPRAIAVVGASPDTTTIHGRAFSYIRNSRYEGKLYPVNPKYEEIDGVKAYPDIRSIPDAVDLAVIAVAARRIPDVLQQCQEKQIPFGIIYSSGFAEMQNEEGARLQQFLSRFVKESNMRLLGPNCQGMFNVVKGIPVTFSAALEYPSIQAGSVGFASQSGAFGFSTFSVLQEEGVGFSYVVSTGNEVDLDVTELLRYFAQDEHTRVMVCYAEGFRHPERLYDVAELSLKQEKPLVVYKVGASEAGSKAAASHTAALAGSAEEYESLFRQLGINQVQDLEELADLCKILTMAKRPRGNRVGILTTSGGAGVALADQCAHYGLEVPALSEETKLYLRSVIPDYGSAHNPVDVTAQVAGSAEVFERCLKTVAADTNIDVIVVALTMVVGEPSVQIARLLSRMAKEIEKPLVIMWTAGDSLSRPGMEVFKREQVPVFRSPRRCVRAIKGLVDAYHAFARKDEILAFIDKRKGRPHRVETLTSSMTEYQAKRWLQDHGFAVTKEALARDAQEAVQIAERIGYPVALKVQSPDISHKTDIGGVMLNLRSADEVEQAFAKIMQNVLQQSVQPCIEGILVQEMVPEGVEVFLGAKVEGPLGPTILFGTGGIFVEVLKDIQVAIPPLTLEEAHKLIRRIQGYPLLKGTRGKKGVDIDSLAQLLVQFSEWVVRLRGNVQIDLNPVKVTENGVVILDALVVASACQNSSVCV